MNAILLMCHKNPNQVIRLIDRCNSKNSNVFVHFDYKMNIDDVNRIKQKFDSNENVYFCQSRIDGKLFSRTLIDMVMVLVSEVNKIEKKKNIHYHYYCLLSGQDYLIKPLSYIENELEKNYPIPYIDCTPYDIKNWMGNQFAFSNSYYKILNHLNALKVGKLRKSLRILHIIYGYLVKSIEGSSIKQLEKLGVTIYGGSQWWILPDNIIDYIYSVYSSNPKYLKYLLYSSIPDETFFQTLAMQSTFKDLIELNDKDARMQNCKTFAYFQDVNKPFKGHPYIFHEDNYNVILESDKWFARKFDMNEDEKIMNIIDEEILWGDKYGKI